ncbi:xanthine dehydrogenase small subunit [Zobellella endophytica]|uniref:Xanthine dehydrogenase small subunit n=1 Tax=Zobellella endophytica TaxID=2116700 RepID=A0A2P7QTS0_9GAMM|nr:xanthine dehydrogenase small subunit [Zobellella endophytica]PSJ41364.1 xanthine dehydrogenase small subunit [Zobellella endophytica]
MIKFLLNQELREEKDLSPNMTVLNYLRTRAAKSGTKEGCASGDCGACTVVLGEPEGDRIRYRSVNSCLTFVSALHGKQLITVEDLKSKDGRLHPVQQSMVDFHGSQCGFCTPGFIMSMFALSKNKPAADKHDILEALAGNLCRCTGYRPIVDAAKAIAEQPRLADDFSRYEAEVLAKLAQIETDTLVTLEGDDKVCFSPTSSAELATLLAQHPDARLLAGGTDLALEVTQFYRELPKMIYVGNVADMKQLEEDDEQLVIGAARSLSDSYEALSRSYPDFGELLHRFASLQIRNQGTLGGNIGNASPIGDAPPVLIALNARLVLRKGERVRELPIEDYFLSYKVTAQEEGEFIEKVIVPKPAANQHFRVYKLSKRIDDDISAVCGAFNLTIANGKVVEARIGFGGMAATPKRAAACEQALVGQNWNHATVKAAMKALEGDFQPLSDFRASKEYRSKTAANLLYKFFIEQQDLKLETRVTSYV